ncbi:hypothetical protein [Pseudomonas sp. Irchel s3b6]|uniref:hypothetical protein n=1 Tax=Pseudomonas sp. Irchel s3b6 TaxID=2009078 RepID=UPI000BA45CCD|nr:hypothetical protein [Pseudomonas sp. Irchel s3b6]
MSTEDDPSITNEKLVKVLSNAVAYVANEMVVLGQYERIQQGRFTKLWPAGGDSEHFEKRIHRVVEHLGGPPALYLLLNGESPPPADDYPASSMREVFDVFQRARKSVIRAHLFMTGSTMLVEQPDLMHWPKNPGSAEMFKTHAQSAFWEHAEAAYIRLSSFWDRIGQVLDFTFFNIRKFDHNGFNAVMDRIHANVRPMNDHLCNSGSWKRLRAFQTSKQDDGLPFLLQRRNLLVHSLHLHPHKTDDDEMFKSQFNHLDEAHRKKLQPREPAAEAALLVDQLNRASALFDDFLVLIEFAPSRKSSHR